MKAAHAWSDDRRAAASARMRARNLGAKRTYIPRDVDADFVPSLRLLICRERYSMTDVGMMFGVTRERARQWCVKYGIEHPDMGVRGRGLMAVRVWDDAQNRFVAVGRGEVTAARDGARRLAGRALRAARTDIKRQRIVSIILALRDSLGREPTQGEIATAVLGRPTRDGASALVVGKWGTNAAGQSSEQRQGKYRRVWAEICAATGIRIRGQGNDGHVDPGAAGLKRRKELCKRGHLLAETRHPKWGYCVPCHNLRENRRRTSGVASEVLAGRAT